MTPVWLPRPQPLAAQAAWIATAMLPALSLRLQQLPPARRMQLQAVQTRQGLLLSSPDSEQLPWLDQVLWLGRDSAAPALWLPTLWQPDGSLPLLEQACLARIGGPCALIPPAAVINGQSHDSAGTLLVNTQPMQPIELWLLAAQAGTGGDAA